MRTPAYIAPSDYLARVSMVTHEQGAVSMDVLAGDGHYDLREDLAQVLNEFDAVVREARRRHVARADVRARTVERATATYDGHAS